MVELASERRSRRRSTRRSSRRRSSSRKSKGKHRPSGNTLFVSHDKYGSLLYGLMSGVTSTSVVGKINKCLPSQWRAKQVTASRRQSSNPEGKNIQMILDILSKIINFVCKYKRQIKKIFIKKLRLRNRKLFLQLSYSSKWGWGFLKKIARNFRKAVQAIKRTVSKVGKGAANLWNKIAGGFTSAVGKIKNFFMVIKTKLEKILNFAFIKKTVNSIIPCFKTLKSAGRQIYSVAQGIIKKITTIASRGFAGLADVFIDLICNFDQFRAAAHELVRALNEGNEQRKYFYYGTFVGQLLAGIGNARFMKMSYFLMKY